jgi:hypothetical protein
MEQARNARIPVHLNAVLIGEKTVPKGCKVRNVSNQGLLLQCDADGRILTFRDGDHVDIHLLFQQPDGTKYQTITATVRHVDANGIGVEFREPDTELVKLIESYRIDETNSFEATISHHRKVASTIRPVTVVSKPALGPSANAEQRQPIEYTNGRRLYYLGLLSLAIAVGIITVGYLRAFDLGARVTALETRIHAHDGELARFQSQSPANVDAGVGNDERMITVESDGSAIVPENKHPVVAPLQQSASAPTLPSDKSGISAATEAAGSSITGVTHEDAEPAGMEGQGDASVYVNSHVAEKHGPWVINLLSSPSKSDADRFADNARKLGIPVEQSSARLKDREFFRVQLTGFLTEKQAVDDAGPVKERLGLKDVWIFKP